MTVRLNLEVSGCDSDEQTDAVLLEAFQRLQGMDDVEVRYSSGDADRSFGTPWDYE